MQMMLKPTKTEKNCLNKIKNNLERVVLKV